MDEEEGLTVSETMAAHRPTLELGPFTPPVDDGRPRVAGYEVVRFLGRGGMGVVWEALEHRFERRVALKVHLAAAAHEDVWAEAFIAARIGDPSIVRVLDVGFTIDEKPYYAMELVEGTDLSTLVAEGALPPARAVAIAADVARAAAAAHEHGVIHRDLKPHNVIIDTTGRARVLDFGVALDIRKGVAPGGGLTGSPAYMAPEQVNGDTITPRTDIFAIGVMLYEMLTGQRPFTGANTALVLGAIITSEPRPPSALRPGVHRDLDAVVMRCLKKAPDDRFPSARALFEVLLAITEGRSVDEPEPSTAAPTARRRPSAAAPNDRPRRENAKKHLVWSFDLRSSPQALWPHVANTDRFNKAVGLGPVTFTDEPRPEGGTTRRGELRVLGMPVRWREFPFEWVKDREHSVFRWYRAGPIAALWNKVTLTPRPEGGTTLTHEIWLTPRGVVGHVATFVEIERKLGPAMTRFYAHLDSVLQLDVHADPFEAPHEPSPEQRAVAEDGARRLLADGFPRELVDRLTTHLLTTPDGALHVLRPYALADAWRADRGTVLDLLIHAAQANLVEPSWDVVCPKCLVSHESLHELSKVTSVGTCTACASTFERDLRDTVELAFVVHPSIRKVERATYCAGAPALRPHILTQVVLDPGDVREITIELPRGRYQVAGAVATNPAELVVSAVAFETVCRVTTSAGGIVVTPPVVRAGSCTFVFENDTAHEETLRVEVPGARADGVAASTALTHPTFRAFFSDQLLAHGEHVRVSQLAFVFMSARGRAAIFEALGDAAACGELTRLDALAREIAREHEGTVIPSSIDVIVLAVPTPMRALRAMLAIRDRLEEAPLGMPVALAAHLGRCIALTRNQQAEFFGEVLHRGQALLADCPERGLALSAAFAADRGVAVALHETGLRVGVAKTTAPGYEGRRVTLAAPAS